MMIVIWNLTSIEDSLSTVNLLCFFWVSERCTLIESSVGCFTRFYFQNVHYGARLEPFSNGKIFSLFIPQHSARAYVRIDGISLLSTLKHGFKQPLDVAG